jgi:hypothetical protein
MEDRTLLSVQPPTNLAAWWPGDGSTADIVGGRNGTLEGGAGYASGEVGQSFSFDGTDGYVQVPDDNLWDFGSNDFAINMWVSFNNIPTSSVSEPAAVFLGHDEGSGNQDKWTFALGGGQLYFHINDPVDGPNFLTVPFAPNSGQWYNLGVTRSGSTFTFYVDGVAIGTATSTLAVPYANAPLTIGEAENNFFMDGEIGEVQIYDRALSPAEVASIAAAGGGGLITQPVTTTALSASANPSVFGQAVTFTATVAAAGSTSGTPTGSVQFEVDGSDLGAPVALVNGVAAGPAIDSLGEGSHTVTAIYSGDTTFIASVSANLSEVVNAAPPTTMPPTNLIAWWPGDGSTADIVGGRNGTLVGGAGYAPAEVGQSFSFDGTDGYVQVPDDNLWDFGSQNFSIDAWINFNNVRPSTLSDPTAIFIGHDEGAGNQNKWVFALGGGDLYFHINDPVDGPNFLTAPFAPNPGQWYNVGVTRSGPTFTFYVDGAAIGTATSTLAVPNANAPLTIGTQWEDRFGSPGGCCFMDGLIDDAQIYDRALSPAEVASIAAAGSGGLITQPVTTTTLSASANPSVYGQAVTFTATVAAASASGTPTGSVQFVVDGSDLGAPVDLVDGVATSPGIGSLGVGDHTVMAIYSGDTNFIASVSADWTQVVNPAPLTVVASSPSITYGGAVPSLIYTYSGLVNGDTSATFAGSLATTATSSSAVGNYAITEGTLAATGNYMIGTFTPGTLTVTPAPLTVTPTSESITYGGPVPALTYTYSGLVNGDTSAAFTGGLATTATPSSAVGNYPISEGTLAATGNYIIGTFNAGMLAVNPAPLTVTANNQSMPFGGSVPALTYTYSGLVNGDTSATFTGSLSTTATSSSPVGTDPITQGTLMATGNYTIGTFNPGTLTVNQSIIALDPSAGGALSLSGNASISVAGGIYVDSSSSSALSASGNASVKGSVIDVHGEVQKSGNASFSPTPVAGAAVMADPLGSLSQPSTSGLTNQGSVSLSSSASKTIQQGIYSSISVSGNASLTFSGGTYIIEGGGLSVSGNASISGTGVLIVNAGSNYSNGPGGTYGSISLSGNGSYKLTPMTTGTYAGIVIFQTRDNSRAMTISGNASGMTGTIYAPAAQLSESGNASLNAALIVDMFSISGNGVANTGTLDSPSGTVAYTPAQIRAAYGISSLSLDGTGQTIAIVDAYDDPTIYQALDAFDQQFGLTGSGPSLYTQYGPASSFLTVLNQYGQATSLPSTDPNGPGTVNWELEEALDVEWAHAIAPGAQIILVEADSQALSDLMAAAATAAARPGVSVVSMSWGFAEGQSVFAADEANYDPVFNVPGVTFLASTGDYGAADPQYPAFSPNVIAVGGTSLTLNADNSYNSETG